MINLNRVNYATGSKEILHDVSFSINAGDKIGLVDSNSAGKTTLLRLINGDLTPTSGEIIKTNEEIGILPQDMRDWLDHSVYEFIEEVTGVKDAREQFDEQCANLEHDSSERTLLLYADALEKYGKFDGLVGLFGVEPVATVGVGMGATTMQAFLEVHELLPKLNTHTDVYIIPIGESCMSGADKLAH